MTAIRGVAALWVVGHHPAPARYPASTGPLPTLFLSGYAAVDTFFVLSGFILATVYRDLAAPETPLFLLKRVCRVYPLHLTIMAALALAALGGPAVRRQLVAALGAVPLGQPDAQPTCCPRARGTRRAGRSASSFFATALFPLLLSLLRRFPALALTALALLLAAAEFRVLETEGGAIVGLGAILRGLAGFFLGATLGCLAGRMPPLPDWLAEASGSSPRSRASRRPSPRNGPRRSDPAPRS